MMRPFLLGPQLILCLSMALAGCDALPDEGDEMVIAPEKEDNFFSNVAQEYLAESSVVIQLDEALAQKSAEERLAEAQRLMEGKTKQIAWFLHVYLIDKSHGDGAAGNYGGLRAMVLDGSYESASLQADANDPLRFTYHFAVQVGGTKELLDKIRRDNHLPSGAFSFPLKMAKLANSSVIHFSHTAYKAGSWSPETCGCELETLDLSLTPIEPSNNAYLDLGNMIADGVMDVSIHVGWDYHARYDITHSRTLYNWLVGRMGFSSPAESYEQFNRLSGPLTKKTSVNGQEVLMKVSLFRPDPCESWNEDGYSGSWAKAVREDKKNKERSCSDWSWADPEANANSTTSTGARHLMSDLKESLKSRDAIIFSGHSGYTYGYALASWYRTSAGDLDPPEIRTLELPRDKSQLFVLSGCDTYHVAQAFKDNPNKLGLHNADVITTTSFSDASDVGDTQDIVRALVGNEQGQVTAQPYSNLMKRLNPSPDYGWGNFAMYGIHGLDDNPLANPLGDASKTCQSCQTNADCGAAGNVCVRLNNRQKVCAVECLHDNGCAADQVCRSFGSSSTSQLQGRACVPQTLTCGN